MMFEQIRAVVDEALAQSGASNVAFDVLRTGDEMHGDLAVNAAFGAARQFGAPARQIAAELAEALLQGGRIDTAAVGGAGFVNLRLSDDFLEASAAALQAAPRGRAWPLEGCRIHTMTDLAAGQRQVWSAQAAVQIAAALGAQADHVQPGQARLDLGDLLGTGAPFKDATAQERAALELEMGRAAAALEGADALRLFAARGGGFRPGLAEAALGDRVLAVAQEALDLPEGLCAADRELARQYVLCHRGDKPLAPDRATLRAPDEQNPVFALHYAMASFARTPRSKDGQLAGQASRRLLCGLAEYPRILHLAHELGEPQRLGIFLAGMAREWIALRRVSGGRDEKAIDDALIRAASVVFSDACAILGINPREEIT
ncbi:hypothetical protein DZK27_12665 [Rhodobacteraceae bacterium 63075]|nr:hypothetical protein DZK27_12665 [Rhodobacteraceae bacterium 63075]